MLVSGNQGHPVDDYFLVMVRVLAMCMLVHEAMSGLWRNHLSQSWVDVEFSSSHTSRALRIHAYIFYKDISSTSMLFLSVLSWETHMISRNLMKEECVVDNFDIQCDVLCRQPKRSHAGFTEFERFSNRAQNERATWYTGRMAKQVVLIHQQVKMLFVDSSTWS